MEGSTEALRAPGLACKLGAWPEDWYGELQAGLVGFRSERGGFGPGLGGSLAAGCLKGREGGSAPLGTGGDFCGLMVGVEAL